MVKYILITGVAGLIGSRFAEYIVKKKQNYKVIGIDDLSGGYENHVPDEVEFHKLNLMNHESVEEVFKKNEIEIIYHFAAYAAEGLSPFIRRYNYNNNLICTTNLVNFAIKYKIRRFVFTSTMATYGYGDGKLPFTEETPQVPIDPYGVAKLSCEMDIKIAGEQHGLDWCIIRPHNVFGRNQNIWDKYRNVLGIWMYQLLNNKNITIFGDGLQTRAFSYIDDMLEPFWKSGFDERASKQCINLGGKIEYSIKEAAETLTKVVGFGKIEHLEPRHEVKHAYCSFQKSVDLLDFEMNIDLEEGLRLMWEWAQQQPMRDRRFWENYELDSGLYSYWKTK
jgi:UDP-glucose 4-epimerase